MGKTLVYNQVFVSLTTSPLEVLGPNSGRVQLIISPVSAGRLSLGLGRPALLDQGITMGTAQTPLVLDCPWFTQELYAVGSAGGVGFACVEVYLA